MGASEIRGLDYWVDLHLQNWVRWMHGESKPAGLPKKASGGMQNYTSFDSEGWQAWEKLDEWTAEATNAAVESLPPSQQAAISHKYLNSVYRFPRDNYEAMLTEAMRNLVPALRRRNVWLGE